LIDYSQQKTLAMIYLSTDRSFLERQRRFLKRTKISF